MADDCRDRLELKFGRRDLLETLDEARERVAAGKTEGILAIELFDDDDKSIKREFAWKDDMDYRWCRFTAAVGSVLHELNENGLEDDLK